MTQQLNCKDLIIIFQKIGGKMIFNYETNTCSYQPHQPKPLITKITNSDAEQIDKLLFDFSGNQDDFVTKIPKEEKKEKDIFMCSKLHNYQEPNLSGFIIEFDLDKDGNFIRTKKN